MLKRVKGMCEDGQAAGNAGLSARAELASDPGSSGSSGGEWEIISGKSDSQHEALARHSVEARFQRIAGPADIDSQEEEDYIRWAVDNPAMAPSKGCCNFPCSEWSPWRYMECCGRPCMRPNNHLHGAKDQHTCDFCVHFFPPSREHLLYDDGQLRQRLC